MSRLKAFGRIGLILLLCGGVAQAIGIRISVTSGGVLEDAILFVTDGGGEPREGIALGDLDLSSTDFVYDVPVDAAYTSWWLLGHEAGNVVYSSGRDLAGLEFNTIEPYIGWTGLDPDIPANLDAFNAGVATSFDWWILTIMNHSSHVTADGSQSNLWIFESPAAFYGTIAVNMHSNVVPQGTQGVPDSGSTAALLLAGLAAIAGLRRR